jgi:hypothetical protein
MAEIIYIDGEQKTLAFEELEDLDEVVEHGPDWHTIDRIIITLNRPASALGEQRAGTVG